MKSCHSALFCSLFLLQDLAQGFRLGLHGNVAQSSKLRRRGNISGTTSLNDTSDIQYTTNLTLNGQTFQTMIDTGSSDLWVAGTVSNAQNTGKTSSVSYAVGGVKGPVKTAALQFAGFTINNQAYIEVTPDQTNVEGQGLIGLGPASGSQILGAIGNSAGDPPLDNIFKQDTSTPNYLTILLSRSNDPSDPFPGDLTVGETVPGFDAVTNQPKLSVAKVAAGDDAGQHWQVLLDTDGIIGPDGKSIPYKSVVAGASDTSKANVVFDSGFSIPQVPKSVADAIYSGISGAKLTNISGFGEIYVLPCDQEINISFVFSGVKYPVHPLDTNLNATDLQITDDTNNEICVGGFQPVSFDSSFGSGSAPLFDMILGMGFLRNAYLLVNYGDFVDGGKSTADPYIQLLSITNDSASVHQDFVKVRLGGNDTTTNKSKGSNSSTSSPSNIKRIAIIAGAAGVGLLVLLFGLCFCLRSRGSKKTTTTGGVMGFGGQTYQAMHEPAPNAASETHALPNLGYNGGQYGQAPPNYGPPQGGQQFHPQQPYGSQQQYQTAWDHHF